jgi:hypothetical protein
MHAASFGVVRGGLYFGLQALDNRSSPRPFMGARASPCPRRRPWRRFPSPTTTFGPRSPTAIAGLKTPRAETRAFIDAENAYTARYLKQARIRPRPWTIWTRWRMSRRPGAPMQRAGSYFFLKRLAGEQQFSIYVRHGWTGKDERLIDPAKLSRDPNTSVGSTMFRATERCWPMPGAQGGADEASVRVFNVKTGKTLEDELPAARYSAREFRAGREEPLLRAQRQAGTLLYQHILGTRNSRTRWSSATSFAASRWAGNDLFGARHRRRPLPGDRDRGACRPNASTLSFAI